jgi:hypothetical protein
VALELSQVEEDPGLAPVAVAARDHRHAQVAARPRTKSVTAAHHRGRVRHRVAEDPAVEDLAAVAETMREPAVTEAVAAWVVAE